MFDFVRRFARYGIGVPHVYYAFNHVILTTSSDEKVELHMSDKILEEMMQSGMYFFWLFGHMFFIEVLPSSFNVNGRKYLQEQANQWLIPATGEERIYEFNSVMQIDFLMERFNSVE